MMATLMGCPYLARKKVSLDPPGSHTAKCHGHSSGYCDLRASSHYHCSNYQCANLEAATPSKLYAQRRCDALLHPQYRAQVTPDPPPADQPLTAPPPPCHDSLDHHKINTCGGLNLRHSDPDGPDCGSEAEESLGPEFFEDPDLHGMAHVMRESLHVPHALIASVTSVSLPTPCSILYENWRPYYA